MEPLRPARTDHSNPWSHPGPATPRIPASFDAALLHLAAEVLSEISHASIWFLVIPAKLTWLLQPLDTHALFKYKLFLKRRFAETFVADDTITRTSSMIQIVMDAVRRALNAQPWQTAFESNGIWSDQSCLSASVRRRFPAGWLQVDSDRPSPAQVKKCWPKNRAFIRQWSCRTCLQT